MTLRQYLALGIIVMITVTFTIAQRHIPALHVQDHPQIGTAAQVTLMAPARQTSQRVGPVAIMEAFEPNHLLRRSAEIKLPGRAWLQFKVDSSGSGSTIRQTAIYEPSGVLGRLYWYALYPLHEILFAGMLRGIANAARQQNPRQ